MSLAVVQAGTLHAICPACGEPFTVTVDGDLSLTIAARCEHAGPAVEAALERVAVLA